MQPVNQNKPKVATAIPADANAPKVATAIPTDANTPKVAAVILAAGNSKRFGDNKLLCTIGGIPMYAHITKKLYRLYHDNLIASLVFVSQYEEILSQICQSFPEIFPVQNHCPELGISHSISLGIGKITEIPEEIGGCLFTVADQPYLTENTLRLLLGAWHKQGGIVCARSSKSMGNPAIFPRNYFGELKKLKGDIGGRQVIRRHMEEVRFVEASPEELDDIDTQIQLKGK